MFIKLLEGMSNLTIKYRVNSGSRGSLSMRMMNYRGKFAQTRTQIIIQHK